MRGSNAGFQHEKKRRKSHEFLLHLLDILFTSFVVAPLVVSYWRGTWNLSCAYIYPHDNFHSSLAGLAIGIVGHLVFTIFQGTFKNLFDPNEHRLTFYIASRLYTGVFGIVCVNTWRGGWQVKMIKIVKIFFY